MTAMKVWRGHTEPVNGGPLSVRWIQELITHRARFHGIVVMFNHGATWESGVLELVLAQNEPDRTEPAWDDDAAMLRVPAVTLKKIKLPIAKLMIAMELGRLNDVVNHACQALLKRAGWPR